MEVHICVAWAFKSRRLKVKPFASLCWRSFIVSMVSIDDWQTNLWKRKREHEDMYLPTSFIYIIITWPVKEEEKTYQGSDDQQYIA